MQQPHSINFTYEKNKYSYIPYEFFDVKFLPQSEIYAKSIFLNLNCGFDIETSRIKGIEQSFMYVWQFAINDITVIGRTWIEFLDFLKKISDFYKTNSERRILCWIHNMSYEFSFLKKWLKYATDKKGYPDVFALDERNVIRFVTDSYIEFRDSLAITNKPLELVAKDYGLGIEKLVEKLNYNLIRHSQTPLSYEELAYCINDVQILSKFNQKYIKPYFLKQGLKIPLTSTGIVRDELKRKFKKINKEERNNLKKKIFKAFPCEKTYEAMMRWLYRGGYNHSNIINAFTTYINIGMGSFDIKSSYPASALHEKFPWRFCKKNPQWFYKNGFDKSKILNKIGYFGTFKFYNICAKTYISVESKNKIFKHSSKAIFDNGRLVKDEESITVVLCEYDILTYANFYTWDKLECLNIFVADKEYLPDYLRDMFLEYFEKKEMINKEQYPVDYMLSKNKLNSLYGMCCTSLFNDKLIFDYDLGKMILSGDIKTYYELVSRQILLPQWGIWISAISRYNLLNYGFFKVGDNDSIYGDTDSIKLKNVLGNSYIFENYNIKMRRLNKLMSVGSHNRDAFKNLGIFDYEGKIYKMKTCGCKRYVVSQYDKKSKKLKDKVTVAGMKKGTLEKKAKNENVDIYEIFENNLKLDENESEKLCKKYNDDDFKAEIKDYLGKSNIVYEKSNVCLVETTFNMSILPEFIKLYENEKNKANLRIGGMRSYE